MLEKSHGFDAGSNPPLKRKVRDHDGSIVIEKATHMPAIHVVDNDGNMRPIPLTNGSGNKDSRDQAGQIRVRRLEQAGCFVVHECPLHRPDMIRHVDEDLRDAPCKVGDFGHRKMCRHVEAMQMRRQELNAKRNAAKEELHKSAATKAYELQKEEHALTMEVLKAQVAEKREAAPKKRRTRSKQEELPTDE